MLLRRVRRRSLLACAALAFGIAASAAADAQAVSVAERLVGSWTLVAVDKRVGTDAPVAARSPRGLLVLDRAGNAFEFFSAAPVRPADAAVPAGAALTFEDYGGFWGRYTVDASAGVMSFSAEEGVSPSVQGLSFSRSFAFEGDRLVVTSTREPQAQGDTRWTWQHFPTVENFSPIYREVVGFWRNVGERQINLATGEVVRESRRGPSVIVYTPAGFVGVHFPPMGREPFAGDAPTAEEAQTALRGYIGYSGTLGVYPGEVAHNVLTGVGGTTGAILRRFARIDGDELVVRIQGGRSPTGGPPTTATEVFLERISGAEAMLSR
jgi:hypothetical protein